MWGDWLLLVLAGSAGPSLLTLNEPIQGLVFSGALGLPWTRVRPRAHRSGWPGLFCNAEACVNMEALSCTPEAFFKHDLYFGAQKDW